MRNWSRPTFDASQPMPAFWVRPKTSPEGLSRRNSGVSGSAPEGPSADGLDVEEVVVGQWRAIRHGGPQL